MIVQMEAHMHFSTKSPFSEPLAQHLDRYPVKGVDFFLRHSSYTYQLQTLRSILQANLAPNLLRELASRTPIVVNHLPVRGVTEKYMILALPNLFDDLAILLPTWISQNGYVLTPLLNCGIPIFPHPNNYPPSLQK